MTNAKFLSCHEAVVGLGTSKVLELINAGIRVHKLAEMKRRLYVRLSSIYEGQLVELMLPDTRECLPNFAEVDLRHIKSGATGKVVWGMCENKQGERTKMYLTPHNLVFVQFDGVDKVDLVSREFLRAVKSG